MKRSDKKFRALFFGCWPPPYGGIASHLQQLLPELAKRNTEIHLVVNLEEGILSYKYEDGVHIYFYNHKAVLRIHPILVGFYFILFYSRKKDLNLREYLIQICHFTFINKIVRKNNIDYFFTHDNPRILIAPLIKAQFRNIKIFATIYADFIINKSKYDDKKKYLISCFKSCDLLLSCSEFCVNTGEEYLGIKYSKKVIYNNVNPDVYNPLNGAELIRSQHTIPKDSIVILTMCKMNRDMGIDFLLGIYEKILQIDAKVVIFFVGASDVLSDKVKHLSSINDRIFYAFNIPGEMKPFYFSAADIFTAPTIGSHACMGIANIEAMMSGLPVVSSDSGGHRETIQDGHDGFIIPLTEKSLDEVKYIEYMRILIKDRALRAEIGLRTRNRALKLFSNDRIVDIHLELMKNYEKL